MSNERVLRHFIKEILRSRMLAKSFLLREETSGKKKVKRRVTKIGGTEFLLSDLDIDLVKDFINTQLKTNDFSVEKSFGEFISSLGAVGPRVQKTVNGFSPRARDIVVRELISSIDVIEPSDFFSLSVPAPDENGIATVSVPPGFRSLAEYKTPDATAASQHGKGELVIPLLFNDASMVGGQSPAYDVKIDKKPWHVKSYSSIKKAIRMGAAEGRTFINTEIFDELTASGFKGAEFISLNETSYIQSLNFYFQDLKKNFPSKYKSIEDVYNAFNQQAVTAAMGKAAGICFYVDGAFSFYGPENFVFVGTVGGGRVQLKLKESAGDILARAKASTVDRADRIVKRSSDDDSEENVEPVTGGSAAKKSTKREKEREQAPSIIPRGVYGQKKPKPPDGSEGWDVGMRVFNKNFGAGTVKNVNDPEKVIVDFDSAGQKKVLITSLQAPP